MADATPTAALFEQMVRMRRFEEGLAELWAEGLISGELHLGIGEEGIVAAVIDHLEPGDALALDHRPTPALVGRGTSLEAMALEMVGSEDGLCSGRGGHMHLFDPDRAAASSGIVGATGPLACGFAYERQIRRPGAIAVAFLGESAINQGMMMEAFNLAAVWDLPVLFVVKDNGWAITTRSASMRATDVEDRVRGFGLAYRKTDGTRVERVWRTAGGMVAHARRGRPGVLHATCHRPRGHFEDDPLVSMVRHPLRSRDQLQGLVSSARSRSTNWAGLRSIAKTVASAIAGQLIGIRRDPVAIAARSLPEELVADIHEHAAAEVAAALDSARSASRRHNG